MKKNLLTLGLMVVAGAVAIAQVPRKINYTLI